jgi:two-component system response regulator YcbB
MNDEKFIIIDDDISICRILENIIEDYDLGEVMCIFHTGLEAVEFILKYNPDIVLVDLLLPDIDGVEIVRTLKEKNRKVDYIMISEVIDRDLVSDAYSSGIEFYINKPINVTEVIAVIRKVTEAQKNKRALAYLNQSLGDQASKDLDRQEQVYEKRIKKVLKELGVSKEKGVDELIDLVILAKSKGGDFKISQLYVELSHMYDLSLEHGNLSSKAIEQRIRRIALSAMKSVAYMGVDNHYNIEFDYYSKLFFGYNHIRKMILHIQKEIKKCPVIPVKSFISGFIEICSEN